MHKYNPQIHHRRSIRRKGHDYSKPCLYFITICCQDKIFLFGNVKNGIMILNAAGEMIEKWYLALESKFPDIKCHEFVVMPNHFHCIIENVGENRNLTDNTLSEIGTYISADQKFENISVLGADQCVCPPNNHNNNIPINLGIEGEHIGSPLHRVVQWFKTMSTNEYIRGVKTMGWPPFNRKIWQRNYFELIIYDEPAYQRISKYIRNNPAKWSEKK